MTDYFKRSSIELLNKSLKIMSQATVPITFRCDPDVMEAFTKLRGDIPQTAALCNLIKYALNIGKLISIENPPVQGEVDQSELAVLKRDIESLKAAIKTDKTKFDKFNKAELADDPIYIKLHDFYGQDIRSFQGLDHNDCINVGRRIFRNDLETARKFADRVAARQKKIEMYEAEHQYKTMKENLIESFNTAEQK